MNDEQQPGKRDTMISDLYREAAGDAPPPSLDAAVLQRALAEVKDRPARASRWSWGGWQARFAALATVVISFTLLLVSQQGEQEAPAVNEILEIRDLGNADAVHPRATPASPVPSPAKAAPDLAPAAASAALASAIRNTP